MVKSKAAKKKHVAKPVAKKKPAVSAKAKPAKKVIAAKAHKPAKLAAAKPVAKAHGKVVEKAQVKPVHKPVVAHKPVAPVKPVAVAKPAAVSGVAAKPVVAPPAAPKKPSFKVGELVVYPAHGVGKISNIEEQEIAGIKLELYIVDFEKEKLRLKVPTNRAEQKGMRQLADRSMIEAAMKVIRGRARIKRTMWSRRAQEYDAKINSGDMISVAEVIRDLYRSERQPEQSYSERQLYEAALDRMAREIAAVNKMSETEAVRLIEANLAKGPRRGTKADNEEAEQSEAA